jgi:hypothetical protein
MSVKVNLAYCKDRHASVTLSQSVQECIMDHQCFSDDPCPLADSFQQQGIPKGCRREALARSTEQPLLDSQ